MKKIVVGIVAATIAAVGIVKMVRKNLKNKIEDEYLEGEFETIED